MGRVRGFLIAAAVAACAPAMGAPASIEACAKAGDPPACLAAIALTYKHDADRPFDAVDSVVEAGAPALVAGARARLVAAAQEKAPVSARAKEFDFDRDALTRKHLRSAFASTVSAAIAVAAAAQIADDPFAQGDAKALIAAAGGRPTIAPLAVVIWTQIVSDWDWRAALVRPRGMKAIWQTAIAQPPRDTAMVAQLSQVAELSGHDDEAVALAQIVIARKDASEQDNLRAQETIAIAPLRARPRTYDAESMRDLIELCYSYEHCRDELKLAGEAGAIDDLKASGADLLRRARETAVTLEKTKRFGLASEAYRLSGDTATALAAAREGMPFVEAAFREAGIDSTTSPINRYLQLSPDADGIVAPAIALYRAGAREEALNGGYVSGYQRFRNAGVAGEAADAGWVVGDRVPFEIDRFVGDLIEAKDASAAARLHDALSCRGPDFYETFEHDTLERHLAIAAALAGRRTTMNAHLAAAAHGLDASDPGFPLAWPVKSLASDWRRALTIAERVAAKDDDAPAPACGTMADDGGRRGLDVQAQ